MFKGENIICFSLMEWGDNPVSHMQIMARLGKYNKVLYVETAGNRAPSAREIKRVIRRLKNWLKGPRKQKQALGLSDIYVYSPLAIPFHRIPFIKTINNIILRLTFRLLVAKMQMHRPILWFNNPRFANLVGTLNEKCFIYHCVDELSTHEIADAEDFVAMEEKLLKGANLVLIAGRELYLKKRIYNRNTYRMPNAANVEHIGKSLLETTPVAPDINAIKHPVIGYVGTLATWVDFQLIKQIALAHPEWAIVLIGYVSALTDVQSVKELEPLSNVHLLGRKDYHELPNYYKAFDVCIVPFLLNEHIMYCNPTKIYEYLATGKPIVSTDFPSAREFECLIRIAKDQEDFIHHIEKALSEEDPRLVEARLEEAKKHSWDARVEKISDLIFQALNSR